MTTAKNKTIVAKDALGQDILLGSIVAAPYTRSMLLIGRVAKISPMTVKVQGFEHGGLEQKRHSEVVVISENPATTMYVLSHPEKEK